MALTHPQLSRLLAGQGQILYPRLKPLLDEQFGHYSDEVRDGEKESDIERLLREHDERQRALERTGTLPRSHKQQQRERAYRVMFGYYLPPESVTAPRAEVIQGLPAATATAILEAVQAGLIPMDIYRQDVKPIEPNLMATMQQ